MTFYLRRGWFGGGVSPAAPEHLARRLDEVYHARAEVLSW
jgi:hypothetical protein